MLLFSMDQFHYIISLISLLIKVKLVTKDLFTYEKWQPLNKNLICKLKLSKNDNGKGVKYLSVPSDD